MPIRESSENQEKESNQELGESEIVSVESESVNPSTAPLESSSKDKEPLGGENLERDESLPSTDLSLSERSKKRKRQKENQVQKVGERLNTKIYFYFIREDKVLVEERNNRVYLPCLDLRNFISHTTFNLYKTIRDLINPIIPSYQPNIIQHDTNGTYHEYHCQVDITDKHIPLINNLTIIKRNCNKKVEGDKKEEPIIVDDKPNRNNNNNYKPYTKRGKKRKRQEQSKTNTDNNDNNNNLVINNNNIQPLEDTYVRLIEPSRLYNMKHRTICLKIILNDSFKPKHVKKVGRILHPYLNSIKLQDSNMIGLANLSLNNHIPKQMLLSDTTLQIIISALRKEQEKEELAREEILSEEGVEKVYKEDEDDDEVAEKVSASAYLNHIPYVDIKVYGIQQQVMLDSGASSNVVGMRILEKLLTTKQLKKDLNRKQITTLKVANNATITTVGTIILPINIVDNIVIPIEFVVLPDCSVDFILGAEWMKTVNGKLDLEKEKFKGKLTVLAENKEGEMWEVGKREFILPLYINRGIPIRTPINLALKQSILLKPRQSVAVTTYVLQSGKSNWVTKVGLVLPIPKRFENEKVYVARGITELYDGDKTKVFIQNFSRENVYLDKDRVVAQLAPIDLSLYNIIDLFHDERTENKKEQTMSLLHASKSSVLGAVDLTNSEDDSGTQYQNDCGMLNVKSPGVTGTSERKKNKDDENCDRDKRNEGVKSPGIAGTSERPIEIDVVEGVKSVSEEGKTSERPSLNVCYVKSPKTKVGVGTSERERSRNQESCPPGVTKTGAEHLGGPRAFPVSGVESMMREIVRQVGIRRAGEKCNNNSIDQASERVSPDAIFSRGNGKELKTTSGLK